MAVLFDGKREYYTTQRISFVSSYFFFILVYIFRTYIYIEDISLIISLLFVPRYIAVKCYKYTRMLHSSQHLH